MAQRAVVALEGGEDDAALGRLVAVVDEEATAWTELRAGPARRHRDDTLISHPDFGRAGYARARRRDGPGCRRSSSGAPLSSAWSMSALAGSSGGRSGALELVGEPGIGKTRLLAELAARAPTAGHLVLSGSASELERELPFWVFVDALDDTSRRSSRAGWTRSTSRRSAELAHVFPSLSRTAGGAGHAGDERYRAHRAVARLLEALAATKPLVLVLDDLHWADAGVPRAARLAAAPPARRGGADRAGRAPPPAPGAARRPRSSAPSAPATL